MLQIEYQQTSFLPKNCAQKVLEQIEKVTQYAYAQQTQLPKGNWEVSLVFTNDADIRAINKAYRHVDKATDVLSFAFLDQVDPILFTADEAPQILGEIFISVERAQEQASSYQHSFEREITFLALHGFLHLLGYDHMNQTDEHEMFRLQERILHALKIER